LIKNSALQEKGYPMKKKGEYDNRISSYITSAREEPSIGFSRGVRPEPTLDDARAELSESISRVARSLFKDEYGPLLGVFAQPAVNEFLKGFEANFLRTKGNLTLIFEELLDRVVPKNLRK
jgi:hypothetical protein